MNGIKNKILLVGALACVLTSCLEVETFVQEISVYEPYGEAVTIAQLKTQPVDAAIVDELYVQGVVTSSDEGGNYAQKIVFQDESGAISITADLSASSKLFPIGQKISVQCKNMMLADIGGVLQLGASVSGDGLQKRVKAIDNRTARSTIFAIDGGSPVNAKSISLSDLNADNRTDENCLVAIQNVFFQTNLLPFANEGGSSEQYRTLYDNDGNTILLCTSDNSTMANESLPEGKGSVTGILTYPNSTPVIEIRSLDDIAFSPSSDCTVNDPGDIESPLFISEYFASNDAYYVEIVNVGTESIELGDYVLARDHSSDGVFDLTLSLESKQLAPFGMVVYSSTAARTKLNITVTADEEWDPLRTNYSQINLDELTLDGNSQVAIMKGSSIVDILSTTNKYNWAANKTLIRRQNIKGHSKPSDYTRADAGWVTKIADYAYNLGNHRFYATDPDFDTPATNQPLTILAVRQMETGTVKQNIAVTGRVTSDRTAGNVATNRLFMQDGSNRGICVAFREGQNHTYNAGDEIVVELYGTQLTSDNGLYVIKDAVVARSNKTASPNQMPEPIEAAVSQIENLQSMYVFIRDVQIKDSFLSEQYNLGSVQSEDLFANDFWLSTLETAEFASDNVSQMSGSIKGIASVDGSKLVIMPRNNNDLVDLSKSRFVAITAAQISVAEMKALSDGTIADDLRVTVTVTSDNSEGNMPSNKIFVQDSNDGFMLQLPGTNSYDFGQNLIVVLKGAVLSSTDELLLAPSVATSVVAIGAPDPSLQPTQIAAAEIEAKLYRLVTIANVQVDETCRLDKFNGSVKFNAKGTSKTINVITSSTATWSGSYIPTAVGSVTGLITRNGSNYDFYPRSTADLSALPKNGTRLNGEKVVYFVPSTAAGADLFISETVMGDLDANGNLLSTVARNKCNSKFVELYNPTANNLTLSNYRVACIKYNNAVSRGEISYYQFPEGLILTPGRTVVFKYVSKALGSSTTTMMTNTLWPKGYTGDSALESGVTVDQTSVPGVILCLDARDFSVGIANSTKSFPAFDGNDILVVQKSLDGGTTWTEIDRLFSLPTADGLFTGKVTYPFLKGYQRKPGKLGLPGGITSVQDGAYTALTSNRNQNDFDSTQCNPISDGVANWTAMSLGDVTDLGVHSFSVE